MRPVFSASSASTADLERRANRSRSEGEFGNHAPQPELGHRCSGAQGNALEPSIGAYARGRLPFDNAVPPVRA
jgi:hypothetical protein